MFLKIFHYHKLSTLASVLLFGKNMTISSSLFCRLFCCFRFTSNSFSLRRSSLDVLRDDGFEFGFELHLEFAFDEFRLFVLRGVVLSRSFCFKRF